MAKHLDRLTGLTFPQAEEIMSNDENSQLVVESKLHHIALSPKFMGDFKSGVAEQLDKLLTYYDKSMDGVPLAYKNVKAQQKLGRIIADQPCIHFDVTADFVLFRPKVGCTLKGTVHSVDKKYAACLVHRCFNAWFLQGQATAEKGGKFEPDMSLLSREVEFRADQIFTGSSVLSIHGTLIRKLPKKETTQDLIESLTSSKDGHTAENLMSNTEVCDSAKKKKSKKQKKRDADVGTTPDLAACFGDDSAIQIDGDLMEDSVCEQKHDTSAKKKKKKKKKQEEESGVSILLDDTNRSEHMTVKDEFISGNGMDDTASSALVDKSNSSAKKKKKKSGKKSLDRDESRSENATESDRVDFKSVKLERTGDETELSGGVQQTRTTHIDVDVNRNVVSVKDGSSSQRKKKKRKHADTVNVHQGNTDSFQGNVRVERTDMPVNNIKEENDIEVMGKANGNVGVLSSKKSKKQKRKRTETPENSMQSDVSLMPSASKKKKNKI